MAENRYRAFSRYLKKRYGCGVYRLSLDAGFTCPNRDGTLGDEGCAYCTPRGSWKADAPMTDIAGQVRREIERVSSRYKARKYIAYFQAYTNTYADPETLRRVYESALVHPDIVGLFIGTRPDCVDEPKLDLIGSFAQRGYEVWVEYGLQSGSDRTLARIGRGCSSGRFARAARLTAERGLGVMAHVIAGLPGEGREEFKNTARFIAGLPVGGVKVHNLNILRTTRAAAWYETGELRPLEPGEYADMVVDFLELSSPDLLVARMTAEAPSDLLIAPRWSLDKQRMLALIRARFEERSTRQGRLYRQSADTLNAGTLEPGTSNKGRVK